VIIALKSMALKARSAAPFLLPSLWGAASAGSSSAQNLVMALKLKSLDPDCN